MFDMFSMLGKLGDVKKKIEEVKASLPNIILEENELDGTVKITISADKNVRKIETSEEFYSKYSKDDREAILTEAINNAIKKADARAKEEMNKNLAGVIPNIPGVDIGSLLGA